MAISKTIGPFPALLAVGLVAGLLAGCTAAGDVDNPITRKASWFSFLQGDDIRQACGPDARDRARLVYNRDYNDYRRIYTLTEKTLSTRRLGRGELTSGWTLNAPLSPWQGRAESRPLTVDQVIRLKESLTASGLKARPPVGKRLSSEGTYWVASACLNGRFHFNAWSYPSDRFATITFDRVLADLDPLDAPLPKPVAAPPVPSDLVRPDDARLAQPTFRLEVGTEGFKGQAPLF